ncbi:hypothetical protein JYB64_06075 [Algoriphagus aestuarii]|nr:hypothetical protein [Algoriphagus aestuarii]
MQKKALQLLLFTAFFILAFQLQAQTVYITKTGAKYHKETCRYAKTGWAAPLTEAKKRGLTPCLVCKPSSTENKTSEPTPIKSNSSEAKPTQIVLPNVQPRPKQDEDDLESFLLEVRLLAAWGVRFI